MFSRRRCLQAGTALAASSAGASAAGGTVEFTLQTRDRSGTPHIPVRDNAVVVPDAPGLGIKVREDAIHAHAIHI